MLAADSSAGRSNFVKEDVRQKAFDDLHLYTLPRKLTLRDRETKQVGFLSSTKVKAKKVYLYQPTPYRFSGSWNFGRIDPNFENTVSTSWEFENTEENGLGVPFPEGTVRFYRADDADKNIEFVGENSIDHTPKNETISVTTGNAFDLIGEKIYTDFKASSKEEWVRETVKITLKNRSEEEKTIIVREPLWRWTNWKIENPSIDFTKVDARTIEFSVSLPPDSEKDITFTAHYTSEPTD